MISSHAEQRRVAAHIENAEAIAAQSDQQPLDPITQIVRDLLLQELARYRAAGQFPKNRDFAERTPYFVDAEGTRCAMAHLLEIGGEAGLVAKISAQRNNAYVKELADEPRLIAWLNAAGLTVEEAAAIQPSYSDVRSTCVCGGGFGGGNSLPIPSAGVHEVDANGDAGTATITALHGGSGKLSVGQVLRQLYDYTGKGIVIEEVTHPSPDAGVMGQSDGGFGVIPLNNGNYQCGSMGVSDAPPLTPAQLASALSGPTSSHCEATLVAIDPRWGQKRPEGPFATGCSTGLGDPTSLGILVSLLTVLLKRKLG